ncbi:MAG: ribonuclease J [Candidatus Sericytochromatia bacterium]|nr:ribonuclease J [Candidatus Tanganyikabacteria bacterium]
MTEPENIGRPLVKVIPLGGLGEIGKNCWVVETDDDLILLDCGFAFPTEEMYGVDLVLPDFQYLRERAEKLRAIFVSHGHEDHIGGLPFLYRELQRLDVPIYGTPFTMALVEKKLNEVSALRNKIPLEIKGPRDVVACGSITVEFIRVCHSIADAVGFAIDTPAGMVIYSGDFKMDQTPMDGHRFDFYRFADLGEKGVLLLLSDSTNAEREGMTPSERMVGEGLDFAFHRAHGRVIVATFSSNIQRIQQIINVAAEHGRKVAIAGRSMQMVAETAVKLGYLTYPEGVVLKIDEIKELPHSDVCIVTTGSQGEPMSGLNRIAHGDHKHINVVAGDTVIISAVPIPGNEKLVNRTINKLFSKGADVIYEGERTNARANRHVSGHASSEELKLMLSLTRPRFFVPIHGEPKHLVHHAELAVDVCVKPTHVFILENGDVLGLGPETARVVGQVSADPVLVDGNLLRDIGASMLKDRKQLAMDGVVSVAVTIDEDGFLVDGPEVMSQGFVHARELEQFVDDAKERVVEILDACRGAEVADLSQIRAQVKEHLAKFLYEKSKRRPVIMAMIQVARGMGAPEGAPRVEAAQPVSPLD